MTDTEIQSEIVRVKEQSTRIAEQVAALNSGKMVITMNGANISEEIAADQAWRLESLQRLANEWEKLLAERT